METVLKITRRGGVAHIELDGDEPAAVCVPSSFYLAHPLYPRQRFESKDYLFLFEHTAKQYALEDALAFMALRERSEKEIRDKLRRTGYADAVIDEVTNELTEKQLLSDARFAEEWVHRRAKQYGRARIAQEMRMKGVTCTEAEQALESVLPGEDEAEAALAQARKALRRLHGDRQKSIQALMRRGYSYSVSRDAVDDALAEGSE